MEGGDHHASKEAEAVARKLQPEHRAALLAAAESLQSPCSLCQDAPEEAVITKCCHVFCRQCIAEQVDDLWTLTSYSMLFNLAFLQAWWAAQERLAEVVLEEGPN